MARFHFHLHECGRHTPDEHGTEHADPTAARKVAVTAAREIMCEELKSRQPCPNCDIDIADDDAHVLARIAFSDVVTATGRAGPTA